MKNIALYFILSCLVCFAACQPEEEEKIDIGAAPSADFTFDFVDDNNLVFTNTTTDEYFLTNWDFGDYGTYQGDVVEINLPLIGEYPVTLSVFGKGGSTSKTVMVTITKDDPSGCIGTMKFLTDCGTKTWGLFPGEGALWVGPDPFTLWWQNSADDATFRDCDWNDDYTFSVDGTYEYDSKGDLWGEPYSGFTPEACHQTSELSPDRVAWGSGTHQFEVLPGNPEKIRVIGDGAFLGLRKAANGMEVNYPQSEVTYDIIETVTVDGVDQILLEVNYTVGIWRFRLAAK